MTRLPGAIWARMAGDVAGLSRGLVFVVRLGLSGAGFLNVVAGLQGSTDRTTYFQLAVDRCSCVVWEQGRHFRCGEQEAVTVQAPLLL